MNWNVLVQGLVFGTVYALVGCSFNVLYRPTKVFNFAQGDLVMIGAMLAAVFTTVVTHSWFLGLLMAVVGVAAISVLELTVAIGPILQKSKGESAIWIITTLAFSIIAENLVGKWWGADPRRVSLPPGLSLETHDLHGALISSYYVAIVVVGLLIVGGLELFDRSRYGRAIAAVAEDRDGAIMRGVAPRRVTLVCFVIGGALAGIIGLIVGPLLLAGTGLGPQLLLYGFEAAALGGIGINRGSLLAGYIIGLVQAGAASLLSPGYQSLCSLGLLLVVLLVKPGGIFGQVAVRDV